MNFSPAFECKQNVQCLHTAVENAHVCLAIKIFYGKEFFVRQKQKQTIQWQGIKSKVGMGSSFLSFITNPIFRITSGLVGKIAA